MSTPSRLPSIKPWVALYQQHTDLRSDRAIVKEIRQALGWASYVQPAVFGRDLPSKFQARRTTDKRLQVVTLGTATSETKNDGVPLRLKRLPTPVPALDTASLSIRLTIQRRPFHLHALDIRTFSTTLGGDPWTVAVHLPDDRTDRVPHGDRQGHGACGHAALHCHIGPTLDQPPKVRVPLPALRPAQVVQWILAQVLPIADLEAAPWGRVQALLKPSRPTPA